MPKPDHATNFSIYLRCAAISLHAGDVLADPDLCALAVDDLCWAVHWDDWLRRRPHRWQLTETRHWHAEQRVLDAERARIRTATRRHGFRTT